MGPNAGELIPECVLAMEVGGALGGGAGVGRGGGELIPECLLAIEVGAGVGGMGGCRGG
jgi:hypothetical protein